MQTLNTHTQPTPEFYVDPEQVGRGQLEQLVNGNIRSKQNRFHQDIVDKHPQISRTHPEALRMMDAPDLLREQIQQEKTNEQMQEELEAAQSQFEHDMEVASPEPPQHISATSAELGDKYRMSKQMAIFGSVGGVAAGGLSAGVALAMGASPLSVPILVSTLTGVAYGFSAQNISQAHNVMYQKEGVKPPGTIGSAFRSIIAPVTVPIAVVWNLATNRAKDEFQQKHNGRNDRNAKQYNVAA